MLVIGEVSVPDLVTTSMDLGLVNQGHRRSTSRAERSRQRWFRSRTGL